MLWGKEFSFKFALLSFSISGSQGFMVFGFHSPQIASDKDALITSREYYAF